MHQISLPTIRANVRQQVKRMNSTADLREHLLHFLACYRGFVGVLMKFRVVNDLLKGRTVLNSSGNLLQQPFGGKNGDGITFTQSVRNCLLTKCRIDRYN